jgi:hypothetical protein
MPQKMTMNLSERLGRPGQIARFCRLAVFAMLAVLAGCGPGTGGTGTGPVQGVSNFSGSEVQGAVPGGGQCQGDCARVSLKLEAERVELSAACRRFFHVGGWTVTEDGKAVLAGQVETISAAGTTSAAATLQLQFSGREPTSPQVTVVLTADGGGLLVGPALLQRGDGAGGTAAPDCRP